MADFQYYFDTFLTRFNTLFSLHFIEVFGYFNSFLTFETTIFLYFIFQINTKSMPVKTMVILRSLRRLKNKKDLMPKEEYVQELWSLKRELNEHLQNPDQSKLEEFLIRKMMSD